MIEDQQLRIVITGGGTGGHLFPGIAVAQEIIARVANCRVVFVGTGRLVDQNAMDRYGFETKTIHCSGLKGGTVWSKVKALAQLPLSFMESLSLLRNVKPSLVLGVGGYVTGPVLLAAKILGIKTCIHEQNSVPGLANRKLGPIVDRIFLSIPGSEKFFPKEKCILTGNPLRKEILAIAEKIPVTKNNLCLLVLGGSQGAHAVNKLVSEGLSIKQDDLPKGFKVVHQTGKTDQGWVKDVYDQAGIDSEVKDFIDDMAAAYSEADVVVSRAGATTLAELTAVKKASILIPYPFAADNHQQVNAQVLAKQGAAKMFLENELTPERMGEEMLSLLTDRSLQNKMATKASEAALPEAVVQIAEQCMKMINHQGLCS